MLDVRLGPAPFLIAAFDARRDFPTELFGAVVSIVEPGVPREYLEHLGGLVLRGRADGLEDREIEEEVLEAVIAAHDPADGEPLLETWLAVNARALAAILDGPPDAPPGRGPCEGRKRKPRPQGPGRRRAAGE